MNTMTQIRNVREVRTLKEKQSFAEVGRLIYQDDPSWICPLDKLIENVFDPARNPCFQYGAATRWILEDESGKPIGRIAAFVNERKIAHQSIPAGGVGFFECIDDKEAAHQLFDTAVAWLKARGMEAMDGPINFGENDRYWGLLVEGFTKPPFTTNYHKPYYRALFESYGFQTYYEMLTHEIDLSNSLDQRFVQIASRINRKEEVEIRHATLQELPLFAQYFREIYNEAWQFHEGFTPITESQAQRFAAEMKHMIIDNFCPFAFVRGEPAGFIIAAPDLNQVFESYYGKFNWWRMLLYKWRSRNNYAWYRRKGILTRGHVVAIGVKPKFQQSGLETGMIMSSMDKIQAMGFGKLELRWAGDFNPKVIRLNKAVGAKQVRKHITLRYMFDRNRAVTAPVYIPLGKRSTEYQT